MKKKLIAGLLLAGLTTSAVYANNYSVPNLNPETAQGGQPQFAHVYFNGTALQLANATDWVGGKTWLPLREIVEAKDLHIHYSAATRSIYVVDNPSFTHAATVERAPEGSFNLLKENNKLDVAFRIKDDKAYIKAEDLAKALGQYYYEDVRTNTVHFFDNDAVMKDGVYTTVGIYRDNRDSLPTLKLTVEDGKLASVSYDEFDIKTGLGKTNPERAYRHELLKEAIPAFEAQLVDKQNPEQVDTITNATQSYDRFVALANEAMAKAKYEAAIEKRIVETLKGEYVDTYKDGTYKIVGLPSGDWTSIVDMVVEDGKIVSVNYDAYMENGESKRTFGAKNADGVSYVERFANSRGIDPEAIIKEVEKQLLETQDPNLVDVATGATSWSNDLKRFVAGALYQAARADVEVNENSTIYVFMGDSTSSSAYYVQLLAVAENNEVKALDYVEFQRGNPIAKQHNPSYVGPTGTWATRQAELLAGRAQLDILAQQLEYAMENKTYTNDTTAVDAITGASNWGKGLKQLVPRAFSIIENQ